MEGDVFEFENTAVGNAKLYYLVFPTTDWGSRRPQRSSLTASTRVSLLVKVLIYFRHVIDWPLQLIFQRLPISYNSVQQGSLSVCMHKTCANHLNLFLFNIFSKG